MLSFKCYQKTEHDISTALNVKAWLSQLEKENRENTETCSFFFINPIKSVSPLFACFNNKGSHTHNDRHRKCP